MFWQYQLSSFCFGSAPDTFNQGDFHDLHDRCSKMYYLTPDLDFQERDEVSTDHNGYVVPHCMYRCMQRYVVKQNIGQPQVQQYLVLNHIHRSTDLVSTLAARLAATILNTASDVKIYSVYTFCTIQIHQSSLMNRSLSY